MRTLLLAAAIFVGGLGVSAQQHNIDTQKSTLTIHVGKAGAFSALGHEHEVHAAIHSGVADTGSHPTVEVHVDARALRVVDKDDSEKNRAEVQKTMLGPEVLDSENHQEIVFKSTGATHRPGVVDAARGSHAARADAASLGASDAEGRPLHRREHRETDRLWHQASRKGRRESQRQNYNSV